MHYILVASVRAQRFAATLHHNFTRHRLRTKFSLLVALVSGCGSSTVVAGGVDGAADTSLDALPVDATPDVMAPERMPDPSNDAPSPPPPPPPPDVPAALPLGAACERDEQCESRVCVRSSGLTPGCAQRCRRDADCASLGVTFSCALDRAAAGGRFVCNEVTGASREPGNDCRSDEDCRSNYCHQGRCRPPCIDDTECVPGWRCVPTPTGVAVGTSCGTVPVSGPYVDIFTLGEESVMAGRGSTEYRLLVPDDAVSIQWTTFDLEGSNVFTAVGAVRSPRNEALVDLRSWTVVNDQPIRTMPSRYQFNSALLPSSDTLRVIPGAYRSVHVYYNPQGVSVPSRRLRASALIKRAPGGMLGTTWRLRLGIWLVGVPGLTATTAPSNTRLQSAIQRVRQIYASANIGVDVVGYQDIPAAVAARYAIIDSRNELQELFMRTNTASGPVLNLMVVRGIAASADFENAIGVAGMIGGPMGLHGSVASGVVVSWETTLGRVDLLPQTIAHECAHYLGLWHTREQQAPCTVATQTMCSPFGGVDPIGDTPTDAAAANYLMYWQAGNGSNVAISPGQSVVMRAHPLVQ